MRTLLAVAIFTALYASALHAADAPKAEVVEVAACKDGHCWKYYGTNIYVGAELTKAPRSTTATRVTYGVPPAFAAVTYKTCSTCGTVQNQEARHRRNEVVEYDNDYRSGQ